MFKGKIKTFKLDKKTNFIFFLILAVTARHRTESSSSNTSEDSLGLIDAFDAAMLEVCIKREARMRSHVAKHILNN